MLEWESASQPQSLAESCSEPMVTSERATVTPRDCVVSPPSAQKAESFSQWSRLPSPATCVLQASHLLRCVERPYWV